MRTEDIKRCVLIVTIFVPMICFAQDRANYPRGMFAELPHERAELHADFDGVDFPVTTSDGMAAKFFQQGLAELYAGTRFEAARAFREVITRDPKCAMGYWGIAMAFQSDASLATEYMWKAYELRASASKLEQRFIESYAKYYGAQKAPEMILIDAETGKRRAKALQRSKKEKLAATVELYKSIARLNAESDGIRFATKDDVFQPKAANPFYSQPTTWTDALRYRAFGDTWSRLFRSLDSKNPDRLKQLNDPPRPDFVLTYEARCRFDNGWLKQHDAMPYECAGYAERWAKLLGASIEYPAVLKQIRALPQHPGQPETRSLLTRLAPANWRENSSATAAELLKIQSMGPLRWTPPVAPDFSLPKGSGQGVTTLNDLQKPTIVVFYLGFGCIHCVEQLNELRPRYKDFKAAGIEIVAIGSDSVNDVKAAILDTLEVDGPETPFETLCDPKHEVFRNFHCWDEFTDEPLHGTFLVDTKGQILWRDISEEPFMETDFLLKESQRLLAQ